MKTWLFKKCNNKFHFSDENHHDRPEYHPALEYLGCLIAKRMLMMVLLELFSTNLDFSPLPGGACG